MKSLEIGHLVKIIKNCICFEGGFRSGTFRPPLGKLPAAFVSSPGTPRWMRRQSATSLAARRDREDSSAAGFQAAQAVLGYIGTGGRINDQTIPQTGGHHAAGCDRGVSVVGSSQSGSRMGSRSTGYRAGPREHPNSRCSPGGGVLRQALRHAGVAGGERIPQRGLAARRIVVRKTGAKLLGNISGGAG